MSDPKDVIELPQSRKQFEDFYDWINECKCSEVREPIGKIFHTKLDGTVDEYDISSMTLMPTKRNDPL